MSTERQRHRVVVRCPVVRRRSLVLVLALPLALLAPRAARAVDWPGAPASAADPDPIAPFRWDRLPAWIAPAPVAARAALAALDRAPVETSLHHQRRAVLLRLLARATEAGEALDRARALSPDRRLDDPDARLTAAWIDASAGRFDRAVPEAREALAAMPPSPTVESLALEVTRWSLARGPEGVDDALALLDALARGGAWSPRAAALRVLALARAGALDEARTLARATRHALSPSLAEPVGADLQGLAVAELANAVGVALALSGAAAPARPILLRALERTPAPWRAFQLRWIAGAPR